MTDRPPLKLVTKRDADITDSITSVISQLETWLKMARAGEVHSIAVAAVYDNGKIGCSFSKAPNYGQLLGSMADMQHTYMKAHEQ
jgi:hypothetical protein